MKRLFYFFPAQLLLYHIKRNYLFIIFWTVLFGFTTEYLGVKYGIPYLFLAPEYMGKVSFLSFFILGLSVGVFIMAFHIASYIIMGYRFRFIATLSSAFFKFCVNNSTIPVIFLSVFGIKLFLFCANYHTHFSIGTTFLYFLAFLLGNSIFIVFSALYFNRTNKSFKKFLGIPKDKIKNPLRKLFSPSISYKKIEKGIHPRQTEVRSYLYHPFKIKLARKSSHYSLETIMDVLNHHHHNAAFYLIGIFTIILILGIFRDTDFFMIPAAASIMLLFSMILMIVSAIHSWFRGWSIVAFMILTFFINFLTTFKPLNSRNHAYGLNYNTEKAIYNTKKLQEISSEKNIKNDIQNTLEILEKWKEKNTTKKEGKPKMIFINCSGGGMRASYLTFHTLNFLNQETNGNFFKKTQLITGSSGGMIGAAYYRELLLLGDTISRIHYQNISKDMLNPISFTITVNDVLMRLQKFNDGKYTHTKDRGFAFEYILQQNTDSVLNKKISDYSTPEKNSKIPMMIISPTIINDGHMLNISSQPIAYMSHKTNSKYYDGIEFSRLFKNQDAENLKFISALRMNATFPYISPVVYLPSNPMLEVMDAGLKDNLGTDLSIKFIHTFKDWIKENTSGIILLQIRSGERTTVINRQESKSFLHSLISPFLDFNRSWGNMRDLERDKLINYSKDWLNSPLDVITITLPAEKNQTISLSWRLMDYEKEIIENSLSLPTNTLEINKLKELVR
ncbi:MAG: patatin-like phospholipase family protein [Flavobacteriales bacterium]|nr:patatin-like phospholipase family protein [Flavobacteriales bacterium]